MGNIQNEIYKTIDILVEQRLKELKFDRTVKGVVVAIGPNTCDVLINGEIYTCKCYINTSINDVVFVKLPNNDNKDKYVESVAKSISSYNFFEPLGVENINSVIIDGGSPNSPANGITIDGGGIVVS